MKLWPGQGINNKILTFDLLSVTFTFDIESWVLYATRLHTIVNISTKYHEDTLKICEVMTRTRYKLQNFDLLTSKCDFDL